MDSPDLFCSLPDETTVFIAELDVDIATFQWRARWLSPIELGRAARFRFDRERDRFISGRGVVREVIGERIGTAPSEVLFRYGPHGKPELNGPMADELAFSISHSDGLILVALSARGPVGVDLERVRRPVDLDGVLGRFFSTEERLNVQTCAPSLRSERFFRLWTRREAWLKGEGRGLASPRDVAPGEDKSWHFRSFDPEPGFVATLATRAETRVALERWD